MLKIITTKQYYHFIRLNNPTSKKLVDSMTKQLQVIRIIQKANVCDEFRERTIQQAKNLIKACQMVEKDIRGKLL